jgi:predicted kinase
MQTLRLIVFSSLPGTGKTVLAEAVGRRCGTPVFSVAWVIDELAELAPGDTVAPSNGCAPLAATN